ncbi:MAG: hypothetical protein ABEJ35_03595 [Halobacteriaceae archaeon]
MPETSDWATLFDRGATHGVTKAAISEALASLRAESTADEEGHKGQ